MRDNYEDNPLLDEISLGDWRSLTERHLQALPAKQEPQYLNVLGDDLIFCDILQDDYSSISIEEVSDYVKVCNPRWAGSRWP